MWLFASEQRLARDLLDLIVRMVLDIPSSGARMLTGRLIGEVTQRGITPEAGT